MSLFHRMLLGGLLALLAAIGFVKGASAADQMAANTALVDKYFAAVNAHDLPALNDVIAENYLQHGAGQGQGRAGMQAAFGRYFQMFPDFRMTPEDSVIAGDKVVVRFRITATNDRPVQLGPNAPLFPPTGRKLAWEGISIWRVANGKFVEHWDVDDLLSLAQQLRS
jgi:predicted ester cyclase